MIDAITKLGFLEIENHRLKKSVSLSQRRISELGARLKTLEIEAERDRSRMIEVSNQLMTERHKHLSYKNAKPVRLVN